MEMISIVKSPDNISTYFDILRENDLEFALVDFRLRKMELMEDFVFNKSSLKSGKIVLEDVIMDKQTDAAKKEAKKNANVTKTQALKDRVEKFIEALKNFFKDLWSRFMGKVDELLERDSQWLAENQVKFDGITDNFWKACSVTCYPYFQRGMDIFAKSIYANGSHFADIRVGNVKAKIEAGFDSDEAMREYICPNIHKMNIENFAEGAKTWYRGANDIKIYKGTDAQNIVSNFISYCKNYKNMVVNIKKDLNKIEKDTEELKKLLNQRPATEEAMIGAFDAHLYSILEDCYLWEIPRFRELALESADGVELSILSEEVTTTKQEGSENKNGSADVNGKPADDTSQQPPGPNSKVFNNMMKYVTVAKIMLTARMTIAEECYKAGMRTSRAILNEASKRNEISNSKSIEADKARKAQQTQAATNKSAEGIMGQGGDSGKAKG